MAHKASDYSWIALLLLAIALVMACSSSSGAPEDKDSGGQDTKAEAMTKS